MEIENRRAFAADLRASILTLENESEPLRAACLRQDRMRKLPWLATVLAIVLAVLVSAWLWFALLPLICWEVWLWQRPPSRARFELRRVNGVMARMKALEADFNQGQMDIETAQARHREWV